QIVLVTHGLGQPEEGRKHLNELLDAFRREPPALERGAELLRSVGDPDGARKLLEEAHEKLKDEKARKQLAYRRSRLAVDPADEITWLEKCDRTQAEVQATLAMALGRQAEQDGRAEEAAGHYRRVADLIAAMPESPATFHEGGIASLARFRATGQTAA